MGPGVAVGLVVEVPYPAVVAVGDLGVVVAVAAVHNEPLAKAAYLRRPAGLGTAFPLGKPLGCIDPQVLVPGSYVDPADSRCNLGHHLQLARIVDSCPLVVASRVAPYCHHVGF